MSIPWKRVGVSWLLRMTPALVALALTGCTSFKGKGLRSQVESEVGVEEARFMEVLGHLLGAPTTPGNQVTTLLNGKHFFPAMLESIMAAERSVCLERYIFWSGTVGTQFAQALAERANAGVQVCVLLDKVGSRNVRKTDLKKMREAGAEVHLFNPLSLTNPGRVNHRDHRKLLISHSSPWNHDSARVKRFAADRKNRRAICDFQPDHQDYLVRIITCIIVLAYAHPENRRNISKIYTTCSGKIAIYELTNLKNHRIWIKEICFYFVCADLSQP